jgi:capsular exopolysaccharide synthesis family protein
MSIINFDDFKTAGKVNFNASATTDYSTNEAFKTLRSNLLFCGKDKKVILVTSALENEGKSTVATELSKSLSEINKKTLLIDADMRKSVILRRNLKTQGILGLSELLSGQATVSQVLYNTQMPDFDVIFSGHFPPNPVELLSNDVFKKILEDFKDVYDYIIIDSPPLSPVIDAAVISVNCDGAILVISSGKVKQQEALQVKEQLSKSGCEIIGVVLNQTEQRGSINARYHKQPYGNPYNTKR